MEAPLLESIELESTNASFENVQNNHSELLEKGYSTSDRMEELINILGGMDKVLSQYLSNNNPFNLSTQQLSEINHILLSISNTDNQQNNDNDSILYLSKKNTFLNKIFSESMTEKIINIIFGKIVSALALSAAMSNIILALVLSASAGNTVMIGYWISNSIVIILLI